MELLDDNIHTLIVSFLTNVDIKRYLTLSFNKSYSIVLEICRREKLKQITLKYIEKWWKYAKYKRDMSFGREIFNLYPVPFTKKVSAEFVTTEWQYRQFTLQHINEDETSKGISGRNFPPKNLKVECSKNNRVPGCLCFLDDYVRSVTVKPKQFKCLQ
tara:strand:+ start:434 stop:907 length:474 start_codon:yes stop_codon:yes gene_type:complete